MTMFNVGDRIIVKPTGIVDARELRNHKGIIIRSSSSGSITVAFLDWRGGHSGNTRSNYPEYVHQYMLPNNVWHCLSDEVLLDTTATKESRQELICRKVRYLETKFKERNTSCLAA